MQIWKSKEIKDLFIKILWQNPDGTIAITYQVDRYSISLRHIHNYQPWYIEQYYDNTGTVQNWNLDKNLKAL